MNNGNFISDGQTEEDSAFYHSYRKLQYANTVGYGLLTVISVSIIIYLRRHRNTAYHGDATAAKKVILPAFEPLLWIVATVAFIYACYYFIAAVSSFNGPLSSPFFTEILYEGRQFINYVVVTTLLQTNLSRRSLYRALTLSSVLVIIPLTFTLFCTLYDVNQYVRYALLVTYRSIMVLGFIYLFIRPPTRGSDRAWRLFCGFVLVYYCSFFIQSQMLFVNDITGSTVCLFTTSLWYAMAPYWIWQLLKADTDHWRGLGQQALLLHKDTKVEEIVSAQGLHVLLEVHQQDVLDFALLKIGHKIGVGATSHVYRGVLSSKTDVAVKVYTPNEITESTIVEFSQETALCAALKHPNIVTFYGVCVCPPAICLVSELCDGSLDEFLSKAAPAYTEPLLARLVLMLDAARAVAHLHSYSPPFLHRDLKPGNFLLGHNHVLKLTDFGESRCMARAMDGSVRSMTIKGTAEYMAPEVIEGKQSQATYSETADIYSLGITLWDILHPGREKYPMQKKNHVVVFEMVLDGRRPPLDPELHPMLRDLLESAWCSSPEYRPSAQAIVHCLEQVQEELCSVVGRNLLQQVSYVVAFGQKHSTVSGNELTQCLINHNYAFSNGEAVRMGNALMDAGILHHDKHMKAFENSSEELYVFHEAAMDLNQPFIDSKTPFGTDDGYSMDASSLNDQGRCRCKKLAQGHALPVTKPKKWFRRPHKDLLLDNNALTVHLLNDAGAQEAVHVSRLDFPQTVF